MAIIVSFSESGHFHSNVKSLQIRIRLLTSFRLLVCGISSMQQSLDIDNTVGILRIIKCLVSGRSDISP